MGAEIKFLCTFPLHAVVHLVEARRCKPEGCGFDSIWCRWNFYCHNPSYQTMTLGSTQSVTEMSASNISCMVKAAGA